MSILRRSVASAVVLGLPLVCTSCFTMCLWGFEPNDTTNPFTGGDEIAFELDEDAEWSWESVGLRLLLTPLALGLDVLTCPVQAMCCCDEDG